MPIASRGRRRVTIGFWLAAAAVLVFTLMAASWNRRPPPRRAAAENLSSLLQAWDNAALSAFPESTTRPSLPRFPDDHAVHPDSPFESWEVFAAFDSEASPAAIRFRLIRLAASSDLPKRASGLAANEFLGAELTLWPGVTEVPSVERRFGRIALGIAGHGSEPVRVWIDGDRLEWIGAGESGAALKLMVRERGLSGDLKFPLGRVPGPLAASAMQQGFGSGYLYPRTPVLGELTAGGGGRRVNGSGWIVHNWGPIPPVGGQVVIDRWFVQFAQGQELAMVRMRRRDGTGPSSQRAFWIDSDGRIQELAAEGLRLHPGEPLRAKSSAWTLESTADELAVRMELIGRRSKGSAFGVGASALIRAEGKRSGRPLSGQGLVEFGSDD
jgi:predicted secreted hydrolase